MPYALITIGIVMVVTAVQDTWGGLSAQVRADFLPFTKWLLAFFLIGALGYVQELRQFSHYLLALVLIGMILSNRGFFAQFISAINSGPVADATTLPAQSKATDYLSALPALPTLNLGARTS